MAITWVENQAVKLYTPSETRFNEKTSECEWHLPYYQLVTCDDVTEIIVNSDLVSEDIALDGTFSYAISGVNDTITANKLVDSTADFVTDGVTTDMYVRNLDTNASAKILAIDNLTTLSLDANIFNSTPYNYVITYYEIMGNMAINVNSMDKGTLATGYFKQEVLTLGLFYKVSIDVTYFESFTVGHKITFKIGGNTILTLDGISEEATGTKTFYGVADGSDSLAVEIYCDANIAATFANLRTYQSSNIVYFIMDCEDDSIVYASDITDIDQLGLSNQLKLSVDWSNVGDGYTCSEGCYYIGGINDVGIPINLMLERFNNNDFDSATDWLLGAAWSIGTYLGSTVVTVAGTGTSSVLEQNNLANNFSSGLSYTITIKILNYVNGLATLKLLNGTTEVEVFDASSFVLQPNGDYTVTTGILTQNCDVMQLISSPYAHFSIDIISAVIDIDFSAVGLRTDCFSLAESHDCTVKLSGTNLDDAFGINFSTNFYTPFVRVEGQLRTPSYEDDIEDEEDSLGVSKMIYFNSDKIYTLHLYGLPEYLHDFIRLLRGYDTFLVDGVQYLPKGGYKPDWVIESNKVYDKANVNFNVKQKTELNKNRYC